MTSFIVVCKKELADHLGSKRFLLLFALIIVLSLVSAYQGAESIRQLGSGAFVNIFSSSMSGLSFTYVMLMFGPIIGLALGFDAINREKSQGSLSVLLSQPIFRDSIINGKFLAGIIALSLLAVSTIGIMTGAAIPMLGFGPSPDHIVRIVAFTLVTILYLSVWLSIGVLFSTLTKKTTTSMLASISMWIFSAVVISIVASLVANTVYPTVWPSSVYSSGGMLDQNFFDDYMERMELQNELRTTIQRFSPSILYQEASSAIITINRVPVTSSSGELIFDSSTGFPSIQYVDEAQDILTNWPQIVVLAVVAGACFAASYMIFLRKEIRAGN
ncbi:MAG: ABC transporter permease [Candidatus Bathyarchaeota archaeon]|nr:ABC transporter permease [Candidatus Bathyarchaeota archaeon]